MTSTDRTITADDVREIAYQIAHAHIEADRAQLAEGEMLTPGGPIGYRTGACSVAEDLRAELGSWDESPSDDEIAHGLGAVERAVIRQYDAVVRASEAR